VRRKVDAFFRVETMKTLNSEYLVASNRYCIRASAVVGTVMPTATQVTGTSSEISQ